MQEAFKLSCKWVKCQRGLDNVTLLHCMIQTLLIKLQNTNSDFSRFR